MHVADSAGPGRGRTPSSPASVSGDLTAVLDGLPRRRSSAVAKPDWSAWVDATCQTRWPRPRPATRSCSAPRPTRSTRPASTASWCPRLADDAVVIGDGGDFVSFAGKFVEPKRPGGWLDPGPYGCLGAGLGAAIAARLARPSAQVVLLLGDGAAGFSLMDVDTLVRHDLPGGDGDGQQLRLGAGEGPDADALRLRRGRRPRAADARTTRWCRALGGAGETVTDPSEIGPALDRAFAAGAPYLVNVITDVEAAYPRATFGDLTPDARPPGPARGARGGRRRSRVAAYADVLDGRRRRLRRRTCATPRAATARPSCGWRVDDDGDAARHASRSCPQGSPWREIVGRRRGRVPDARRGPGSAAGRGVGEALVAARRSTGSASRAPRAIVLSTTPTMAAAHRLYERLGFRRVPRAGLVAAARCRR